MPYYIVKVKTGGYIFNQRAQVASADLARKFTTRYHAGAYARRCGYTRDDYEVLEVT
ncbi:MAG: hypothetical protein QM689_05030 [Oscillospiraceae bacterium]